MKPLNYCLLFFSIVCVPLITAPSAHSETRIHGTKIRTVDENALVRLRVCTTSQAPIWKNPGSNESVVVFCPTAEAEGVRPLSFAEALAAVAEISSQIFFQHDSTELSEIDLETVRALAEFMNATPTATLALVGHTDATGAVAYNLDLSRRRVAAVLAFLTANGVSASQISAKWYGESRLVVETARREYLNRRVELTLTK